MERNLAALRSGSGGATPGDLLPLLASAGSVIRATPDTRLRGVQYGEASLTLELTLKDFQAMEVMKNALAGRGLNAEVLSANSREGLVEGRMRIRAGGRT
jgi:type II secretory pathway component PulL